MNYLILILSVFTVLRASAEIISKSNLPKKIVFGNIITFLNDDNTTLTLNKDSGVIVLKDKDEVLLEKLDGIYRIRTFTKVTKEKIYQVFTKTSVNNASYIKVGGFIFWNKTLFSSTCSNQSQVEKLNKYMGNIKESFSNVDTDDLSQIIVDPKCNRLVKGSKVNTLVIDTFLNTENSYLTKCLSSSEVQDKLSEDKSLSDVSEMFVLAANKFAAEIGKLKNGSSEFKVSCEVVTDPKIKYAAKYENNTITFPTMSNDFLKSCMPRKAVVTHEFFHYAGVRDEKRQKVIDELCAEANSEKDKIESKACKELYLDVAEDGKTSKSLTEEEIGATSKIATPKEQAKLAPILQQEIGQANSAKEITVSENDWNSVAQASDSSNPRVKNIKDAMSDHFFLMSGALNRSVELLENTAHASAGSSSRSIVSTGGTATNRPRSEKEYVAEEYFADKYRVKTLSANDTASTKTRTSSNDKSLTSNGVRKAAAAKNISGGKSETALSENISRSLASSGASSNDGSVGKDRPANRAIAQAPIASSKWINLLQKESIISGNGYEALKASYNDEKFKQQLAEKGITIQVIKGSGSIFLGADHNKSSLKFFDDGQSIRRSDGEK